MSVISGVQHRSFEQSLLPVVGRLPSEQGPLPPIGETRPLPSGKSIPNDVGRSDRIAQASTLSAPAQRLLEGALTNVIERVRLGAIKLPRPIDLDLGIEAGGTSARYSFDPVTRKAEVIFSAAFLERMAQLEAKAPGLARATIEAVFINELHGVFAFALADPRSVGGKASPLLERASNDASRAYINKYYSGLPYTAELLAVWDRVDLQIANGLPPYTDRSDPKTPQERNEQAQRAQEALKLLGLAGGR